MQFFDNFTVGQSANTTIAYSLSNNSWEPPSSRTTSLDMTISGSPDYYAYNNGQFLEAIAYTLITPLPWTSGETFTVYGIVKSSASVLIYISVNGTTVGSTTVSGNNTEQPYSILCTVNATSIPTVSIAVQSNSDVYLYPFSTTPAICLDAKSLILTKEGYREIETLQRGQELLQGKIARIITYDIKDKLVELAIISKNSLGKGLPDNDIIACSNHIFIYKGKRVLAKDLPKVEIKRNLGRKLLSDGKLYDIQYDFEGSYIVSGLESQSRSPYCKESPLPKELYFKLGNYKVLLVDNTLREDPPFEIKSL